MVGCRSHTLEISLLPSQTEWDKSPIGMDVLLNLSRGNLWATCEEGFIQIKEAEVIVVGIAFDQSARGRRYLKPSARTD